MPLSDWLTDCHGLIPYVTILFPLSETSSVLADRVRLDQVLSISHAVSDLVSRPISENAPCLFSIDKGLGESFTETIRAMLNCLEEPL